MRYILETIGDDDSNKETVVSKESSHTAYRKAVVEMMRGTISKVTLWREFDSMEEAPSDDGCGYRLIERDGKRVLRRCSAATGL